MESHKYGYSFKLVIVGDPGVGKTSLLLRFTDDSFSADHLATIGGDFKKKIINIENQLFKLYIWDIAGEEHSPRIYYKGARGVILIYDVTEQNSFQNVHYWLKQIERYAKDTSRKVLVWNKCDKPDRVITTEEGKKLADDFNMNFFETSAKTYQNVNEVFNFLATDIQKNFPEETDSHILDDYKEYKEKDYKKNCYK